MESKDTIGNIATIDNSNENILFIIVIIAIVIVLYSLFKPKTPKVFEHRNIETQPKTKAEETFVKQEVTGLNPVEVTNVTISKSDTSIIEKPIEEIPQPPVEETIIEVVVKEEEEEHSKEKYIGYNPINIFAQTEPLYFPYVMMPKPNCVIKFPRKGRTGRKGYKEEAFKEYMDNYFKSHYQVYDDRFVLVANNTRPYEPDFTLINEKNGINIFVDIEIDEPYEGTNDIENRKPTHFKYSDTNRNYAFTTRGWIVIRFAEIQIHQQPEACCKFIAHVLKSIDPQFTISESLLNQDKIQPVLQWTEEEAKQWSLEKYRERYLGIDSFGVTANTNQLLEVEDTELGEAIEELVEDHINYDDVNYEASKDNYAKVYAALFTGHFLSLTIAGEKTIVKPTNTTEKELIAFCYVMNKERTFPIQKLESIEIKKNYFTARLNGPTIGIDKIANIVNTAIEYEKFIRMKYTRMEWTNYDIDEETGEMKIIDKVEAEESLRTISNIQLAINNPNRENLWFTPNERHITAHCHKREEERMFRFDRIGEIEILDI